MKLSKRVEWFFGFFFGLLTPLFGTAIFIQTFPILKTVDDWYDPSWQFIMIKLATFGVMLNALIFFVALRFDKDKIAMGVLWASGVYLVPIVIAQFLK